MLRSVLSRDVASDSNSAVDSRPNGLSGVSAILEVVVDGGGDDPETALPLRAASRRSPLSLPPLWPSPSTPSSGQAFQSLVGEDIHASCGSHRNQIHVRGVMDIGAGSAPLTPFLRPPKLASSPSRGSLFILCCTECRCHSLQ